MNAGSWSNPLHADKILSKRRLLIAYAIQEFQQLEGISAFICEFQLVISPRMLGSDPHRLFEQSILKRRLQQLPLRPNGRLPPTWVLLSILHPLASHRPPRSTPSPPLYDHYHGLSRGRPSSLSLPSPLLNRYCVQCRH